MKWRIAKCASSKQSEQKQVHFLAGKRIRDACSSAPDSALSLNGKNACPRRESNPDLAFRKRSFYPLNYGDKVLRVKDLQGFALSKCPKLEQKLE